MKIIKTQKGALSILGGQTDMGKSTIAVYDCAEELRDGKHAMFFSYEYCQSIIYNKLVDHFGLNFSELFSLNVVDARGWNLETLISAIRRAKGTVDVVYIDFFNLLLEATYPKNPNTPFEQKIDYRRHICEELAKVAYELQISIVLLTRLKTGYSLDKTIDFINIIASSVKSPVEPIMMFIGKDEILNPHIQSSDMSHVILVRGNELSHFSSINLKQAYKY